MARKLTEELVELVSNAIYLLANAAEACTTSDWVFGLLNW